MARNDVVNSDGSINYNTIGGFKDRLDGHDTSLAQIATKVENMLGANDTEKFQNAINTGLPIQLVKDKTYNLTNIILIDKTQIIGNNAILNFTNTTGDAITANLASTGKVYIENLTIQMPLNSSTVGLNLHNLANSTFTNLHIEGGQYGIKYDLGYCNLFDHLFIHNFTQTGFYIQGDNGAEEMFRDLYISCNDVQGQYGFEIERTTANDSGGYYMYNVLCLGGGNKKLNTGFYFHSSAPSMSTIVIAMVGGGSDQTVNEGMILNNVGNARFINAWLYGGDGASIKGVKIIGGGLLQFSNNTIPSGYSLDGNIQGFRSKNNFIGSGQAYTVGGSPNFAQFDLDDFYKDFSNNPLALSNSVQDVEYHLAKTVITNPNNGKGAIAIANANDLTQQKFIRMAGNELTILDSTFSNVLVDLWDSGVFHLPQPGGAFMVNNNQVVNARKHGWTAWSGTANRGTFNADTATTQQVAQALKALIDDLISHGLIGS